VCWQKPNVLECALAFFAWHTTFLYMARSVQIKQLVSDEARAEFLNFTVYLFSLNRQI
jgi:hypothetical protein